VGLTCCDAWGGWFALKDAPLPGDATLTSISRYWRAAGHRIQRRCDRHAATCGFPTTLWTLVRLLSGAVNDPDPSTQLYGDGLIAAITARLFAEPPELGADPRG